MHPILFLKLILLSLILTIDLFANSAYKGSVKQDVNVRLIPDFESKVTYILRKNQIINIYAIVKTKNKGTWYKIDNGYVVMRFISTDELNIPIESFDAKSVVENIIVEEIKTNNEEIQKQSDVVVQDIQESKEDEITSQLKPIVENNYEADNSTLIVKETKIEQNDISEPVIIKKEESFISKYINFEYILYGLAAIVILIIIIILVVRVFSRPSITEQISQHQKMNADLKKALSNSNDK